MRTVFGPAIDDIKYYWTLTTEVDGIPVVISRTGWTGEVGYEIYLRDPSRGGDLWDRVMEAGKPHKIRPIAPCEARRIEAGIFNYGSDITINDTPFHVMGLERLVEPQDADYIGKAALEEIRAKGVDRKLVGIEADGDALPFELSRKCDALHDGEPVGTVTDLIWSPRLKKNIGYVWLPDRPGRAGHAARDRGARRRALAGADRGDPVPRPEEDRPARLTLPAARTSEPGTQTREVPSLDPRPRAPLRRSPRDELATIRREYRAASLLPEARLSRPGDLRLGADHVLRRDWVMVAREEDVPEPGTYTLVELDGENVIVVRGRDEVLRAFFNVCRHRGTAVAEEACGKVVRFQCPYHAWIYDLDGSLIRAKHTEDLEDFSFDAVRAGARSGSRRGRASSS